MSEALQELGAYLAQKCPDAVIATEVAFGELNVTVQPAHLESLVTFLRDDAACRFTSLVDITAVDHPERAPRFDERAWLHATRHPEPERPDGIRSPSMPSAASSPAT